MDKSRKRRLSETESSDITPARRRSLVSDEVDKAAQAQVFPGAEHAFSGEEKIDAEYSGMIEPPLIKQLKRILSEYPDNGQIIKELIQNAEDAEASEVQVIYDQREINHEVDEKNWFTKFFKGPALCVTNNAKFAENDWKGIKMIASSVKEDKKLKVGRFGMGFKSVFHMTDFPCIISGDRILLIDPTGHSNKINAEMKLSKLYRYKGMDTDAFFRAFRETVGIDENTIRKGQYNGTVFWFPLRNQKSNISPTIYDNQKTMALFMSFVNDASDTLLFLLQIVRVSLKIKDKDTLDLEDVLVADVENDDSLRTKKNTFLEHIERIKRAETTNETLKVDTKPLSNDAITCSYNISMTISKRDQVAVTKWIVLHYYMGKNASKLLQDLAGDRDLGLTPCVGLAFPVAMKDIGQFESRIFCFLPLPKEGITQTGLPVHVNGFFALNQSRHHLKWQTDDQDSQAITDRDIQWNNALIDECLTEAYRELINVVLQTSNPEERRDTSSLTYRLIPNEAQVQDKWKRIPSKLRPFVQSCPFLFSSPIQQLVTIDDALFAMFSKAPQTILEIKDDLIATLKTMKVPYVSLDQVTFDKLKFYSEQSLDDLTPERLASIMIKNVDTVNRFTNNRKHAVLAYVLSGNNYTYISGLPLLPVSSGEWRTFDESNDVYLCQSREVVELFPAFQDCVVIKTDDISESTWKHLGNIATEDGLFQLKWSTSGNIIKFLTETLAKAVGPSDVITDEKTYTWLQHLWEFLDHNDQGIAVIDLPELKLIPEILAGTSENAVEVYLHPTRSHFLETSTGIPREIKACFNVLNITVVEKIPVWIPKQKLANNIFSMDEESLSKLLKTISNFPNLEKMKSSFNTNLTAENKDAFVRFIGKIGVNDDHTLDMLKELKMFRQHSIRKPVIRYMSVSENPAYVNKDIPVELPKSSIKANTDNLQLLLKLSAAEYETTEWVKMVLTEMSKSSLYGDAEVIDFFKYFLTNFGQFEDNREIKNLARNIPFLLTDKGSKKIPRELFDQNDQLLKDIFIGEHERFPGQKEFLDFRFKAALQQLGLKGNADITADDILSAATLLDKWKDSSEHTLVSKKSTAVLIVLERDPPILQQKIGPTCLIDRLKELNWILPKTQCNLPSFLPEFCGTLCKPYDPLLSYGNNEYLVGATMPLVQEGYPKLEKKFGWNAEPPIDKVSEQLVLVKNRFDVKETSLTMPIIEHIYGYFSRLEIVPKLFETNGLLWTGRGFDCPENVLISVVEGDIENLEPYFFTIPSEFRKYRKWFEQLGCHTSQSVFVLQQVLVKLERKHRTRQTQYEYEKDRQMTVRVIEKIAERREELHEYDVLLPIQQIHKQRISYLPASKCTADKNAINYEPVDGDNSIAFVHDSISVEIAKVVGAKPLNKQILSGTESFGIQSFGQKEKLTDRLHKLVEEGYKDGLSVPKELIQNADDAGANNVKFLFDEREHSRSSLFSSSLAQCQGPAIFVYNDACFTKSDFENITKLNGATKQCDTGKIGRFGLGFCAVYNLTDVPSFISNSTFVMFDPHKTYLNDFVDDDSPGVKVDFSRTENYKLMKIYKDQFVPFQDVFDFDISSLPGSGFSGTLFRLPLRTFEQASRSEISCKSYSTDRVKELIKMFADNVGNMLLYTQHVRRIEFYHIPKGSNQQVLILTAVRNDCESSIIPNRFQKENPHMILQNVSTSLGRGEQFKAIQKIKINIQVKDSTILGRKCRNENFDSSWIVLWETGGQEKIIKLAEQLALKGVLPLASVAVPCDPNFERPDIKPERNKHFYREGHLFCFLPLPIKTDLKFHISCPFDITSDRQRLAALTTDDNSSTSCEWNELLLADASVNALFSLLQYFTQFAQRDRYYQLWPITCLPTVTSLYQSFFRRLVLENKCLFFGENKFNPFSEITFLDPEVRENFEIGESAFQLLSYISNRLFQKTFTDVPSKVVDVLKHNNDPRSIGACCINKEQFLKILLQNLDIEYWTGREVQRTALLTYCLQSGLKNITTMMERYRCVPVKPKGILKLPSQIVEEDGNVSQLFTLEDEVFTVADFQKSNIKEILIQLGMITDILPDEFLIDRCSTIDALANIGHISRAVERCQNIMRYLKRQHETTSLSNTVLSELKVMYILPIMEKPDDWPFTWHADTNQTLHRYKSPSDIQTLLALGKPCTMYTCTRENLLTGGCAATMIDKSDFRDLYLPKFLLLQLGLRESLETDLVIKQMCQISTECRKTKSVNKLTIEIFKACYKALQERFTGGKMAFNIKQQLEELHEKPVVLIGKKLYKPQQVAFKMTHGCNPYLHELNQGDAYQYRELFQSLGVREKFTSDDFVRILQQEKQKWNDSVCRNVAGIVNILHNLVECDDFRNDLSHMREHIIAPDVRGKLYPMRDLVIADDTFETRIKMHIVHRSVPDLLAERLGVKHMKQKCFDTISIGIPFGQKEKLESRLRSLLQGYPCDASIMKELLQNADDAEATELNFIKDYASHPKERIFGESCANMQGPALCVYNNKNFTEYDLQGIQDLGEGSKREDPTKTGQYGVGFNAAYHLTDTPSFLTKGPGLPDDGLLCIFDPTCKHIPGVRRDAPGVRCNVRDVRENYPDVLSGYLESENILFHNSIGTVFRFPLRSEESVISKSCQSPESIDRMLSDMQEDMFYALLFVKHVNMIRVSYVINGQMVEEYSVHAEISEEDSIKRNLFFNDVKDLSKKLRSDRTYIRNLKKREIGYNVTLSDSEGRQETFYVVQRFGFDNPPDFSSNLFGEYCAGNLGCLPLGGVAFNTSMPSQDASKAFCFLPLPGNTMLPVHINGHFALDHETRRDLWKDGYRKEWNEIVIQDIIVPAYVQCIEKWKALIQNRPHSNANVRSLSVTYHSLFPIYSVLAGQYWRLLVSHLYQHIVSNKLPIFPVVKEGAIEWVPLSTSAETKFGCFWTQEYDKKIERILKAIGMKILQTPLSIRDSIEHSGTKSLACTTPTYAVFFLASHGQVESPCTIGPLDTDISNTTLANSKTLKLLISFIGQSDAFCKQILNIPILLTDDNKLRVYSNQRPVYSSEFCVMFPESGDKFIHRTLLSNPTLSNVLSYFRKIGLVQNLGLQQFIELIPSEYRQKLKDGSEIVQQTSTEHDVPSIIWIKMLWKFIYRTVDESQYFMNKSFPIHVRHFNGWCFLPAKRNENKMLLQIDKAHMLLNLDSFDVSSSLRITLTKLPIAVLDKSVFLSSSRKSESKELQGIYQNIMSLVTNYGQPNRLINYLYFWTLKDGLQLITDRWDNKNAIAVTRFLSQNVEEGRLHLDQDTKRKLKALPLFVTQTGTLIPLGDSQDMYVVPEDLPIHGLEGLAASNILLLRDIPEVKPLFGLLNVTVADTALLYTNVILPRIESIQHEHWLDHIGYIKRYGLTDNPNDGSHTQIKNVLRHLAFIPTDTGYKKCSDFYSHENTVFQTLCPKDTFLPNAFQTSSWTKFISSLGMVTEVTDELLLKFARQISQTAITDRGINTKSQILTDFFNSRIQSWRDETMYSIKNIPFIVPAHLPDVYTKLFRRNGATSHLICCNGSVEKKYIRLCWTTRDILPFDLNQRGTELGIESPPELLGVIQHVQNVSTEIEKHIKSLDKGFVHDLMTTIYIFFKKHTERIQLTDSEKKRLEHFPIIYLPEEHIMVGIDDVVNSLSTEEELKPYLFQPPYLYYKHFPLFVKLGVSESLECYHCVKILSKVQAKTKNDPAHVQEMRVIKKSIELLLKVLNKKNLNFDKLTQKKLYLPNKKMILCESTDLIVSNSDILEKRLQNIQPNYFLGFRDLELPNFEAEHFVDMLPEQFRPHLLTSIVTEHYDRDKIVVIDASTLASRISICIHSSEYITGMCRIVKKFMEEATERFDRDKDVARVKDAILRIKIKEVSRLETYLKYKGEAVQGTSEPCACFNETPVTDNGTITNFYFKLLEAERDSLVDVISSSSGLAHLMVKSVGLPDKAESIVGVLLQKYEQPGSITRFLDKEKFPSLNVDTGLSSVPAFPKPGTYVEEKFHAFLEQEFSRFDESEYLSIAMELSAPTSDDDPNQKLLYIYVHIIEQVLGSSQSVFNTIYLVDVGKEHSERVPAYRLYRFVRRQTSTTEITVFTGNTPEQYLPFDENSRRIENLLKEVWCLTEEDRRRIIRRLLLQWHPDRNRGTEEYASKIFDFIKGVIEKLEREECSRSLGTSWTSGYRPGYRSRSRYFFMFNNIGRRAKTYARSYNTNIGQYNQCYSTGIYSHISSTREPVKDEHEARRWLKQAKCDFKAASAFLDDAKDVEAYNWICYTCHQATKLETLLGDHTRMRYPDTVNSTRIPSETFTKEQAEEALQIAKKILKLTDDLV